MRPFPFVVAAGVMVALFGVLALAGWGTGWLQLASFGANRIPMAPSTALLFILYGLTIGCRAWTSSDPRLHRGCLVAGIVGAGMALGLFVLGSLNIRLAIEHLGFRITGTINGAPAGYMSPVTAGCFLLASVSFLGALLTPGATAWRAFAAMGAAVVLLGICYVFLLAYFFGSPLLYGGEFIPPALNTILAFTVLGLALLPQTGGKAWRLGRSSEDETKPASYYLLVFVLLAVGIVAASYFYYRSEENNHRTAARRQLSTIANLKREDLAHWRNERLADGVFISRNTAFVASVRRYFAGPDDGAAQRELREWLRDLLNHSEYDRVSLLDPQGVARLSSAGAVVPLERSLAPAAAEALRTGEVMFLDFPPDAPGREPDFCLLAPVFDPDDRRPLGLVLLVINPGRLLYPLLNRWPMPSQTAETLLVRSDGNETIMLNPPRLRRASAPPAREASDPLRAPGGIAAGGADRIVDRLDYRGVRVIAVEQAVPGTSWRLILKLDASEVDGPMRERLLQVIILIAALLLSAGAGAGVLWSRQQSRHHRERLLAVQAKQGSDARFRAVVDSANDAIVTINTAGEISGWNRAAERIFGYATAEVLGQSLLRLLPPAGHDPFLADLRRIQAGAAPLTLNRLVELSGQRKDETVFPMEMSVAEWRVSGERFFTGTIRDITGRKIAEETLRLQSTALSAAANAIVITDPAGRIIWANPAFTDLTGYAFAEAVGRNPRELLKSDRHDQAFFAHMWRTILAGNVWRGELFNRRKDGSIYPEEQTITPVRDEQGGITHFIAIKQDLTERRQNEDALRASVQQFRAVFEQAAVGVVIARGEDERYVRVNQRFCEIVGYPPDELLRRTTRDLTHPDDLAVDVEQAGRVRDGIIREFTREKRFRRRDGTVVWTKVFVAPLDPAEMPPSLRIEVIADITERKQAERRLREQNEILSNAHEGVMIVTLANEISFWNRGAERIFGWSAEEALGRPPEQVLGVADLSSVERLRAAVEREGFWSGELRAHTRQGQKLIVEARITLVRDESGAPRARLSYLADITEQKTLEEKFLHAQRLESIGMLAAGLAHDLNNVLAPIVFTGPLLRESLTAPHDLKILDTLERSAARGVGLVKQILGFAHAATGERRALQVKHLARDIIDVIEATFPKSIRLEHQIPTDLWSVEGNATQIHQVLLNLCVNARDAMPEGGTLRLTAANVQLDEAQARALPEARAGSWLVLEVGDSGPGIAPDVLANIWEPFFTTKGAGHGTGLGLSTVRGIVVNHHGFVTLDTKLGGGTTFRVYLPATPEDPGAFIAQAETTPAGNHELILVVDDETNVRDLIATILRQHGYDVICCADGVQAMTSFVANSSRIALVITDVDMPHLGGALLTRMLLQMRSDLRVLAISGLSDAGPTGLPVRTTRELAHAFLPKPFGSETLLKAVYALLHPETKA